MVIFITYTKGGENMKKVLFLLILIMTLSLIVFSTAVAFAEQTPTENAGELLELEAGETGEFSGVPSNTQDPVTTEKKEKSEPQTNTKETEKEILDGEYEKEIIPGEDPDPTIDNDDPSGCVWQFKIP